MHTPPFLHFLPIILPTLTSALTLPTNSSLSLDLPPLLPPQSSNLTTDLSAPGPSCFDASKRILAPVSLDSCLDAITRVGATLPPSIYLLPRLFKTQAADVPGGTKVPISWRAGGCMVEINSARGQVGLADAAEFSLIGAAYFASLVVDGCVEGQKLSVGGRFVIKDGGFFVDVRASESGLADAGEVGDGDDGVATS